MFLSLEDLNGRAIGFRGRLIGMHAVFTPTANRVLAMILQDGFRQYIMYLSQVDSDNLAIELEAIDPDHPLFGSQPQ